MTKIVSWYNKTYSELDETTRLELKQHMANMDSKRKEDYILYMTNHMGYTWEQLGVV